MKRIIVSLIAALAVLVPSAGAVNSTPTGYALPGLLHTGTRSLSILADTPFYFTTKFVVDDPNAGYCGGAGQPVCDTATDVQQSSISLTVDGKTQNGSITLTFTDTKPRTLISKAYLFNFASGLPVGTYTFVLTYTIRGQVVLVSTTTVYSLASCQYGTITSGQGAGILCAPPPPPA
jgi:hypothetical protein